jgi:hypothetical protein
MKNIKEIKNVRAITKACYQRGSGVLGQCSSFVYLWNNRTGNGLTSPRRTAGRDR